MKRIKNIVFSGLTSISLALCVLAVLFWARSHFAGDYLRWYRQPRIFEMMSNSGLLRIAWGQMTSKRHAPSSGWEGSFWPFHRVADDYDADLGGGTTLGFRFERWQRQTPDIQASSRIVTLPYWALVLCFALAPCLVVLAWHRNRRRVRPGHCPACGYDLRASPDRCPECGTPVAPRDLARGQSR